MTTTTAPERVFRVRDAAAHLDCDPDTIYKEIREGRLRAIRVGRLLRVPESALAAFIDGH
ncbi:MAG: helix-turn-helix domain-containing protein [Actinomycetota bacterium]|nr:helix-turn-helix domain-containing protein [Actinomycetota bacterium]